MAGIDPKVKNLIRFILQNVVLPVILFVLLLKYLQITDYFRIFGIIVFLVALWRTILSVYRRVILPGKKPQDFGKWAIVTGSTSGIGKEFADYLSKIGMSVLIISRSEDKLKEQAAVLKAKYSNPVRHLAYDFTKAGEERTRFYDALKKTLKEMDTDGGVGLLINNVGIANEIPKDFMELTEEEIDDMIQCNIYSTIQMTRTVFPFMQNRKNGCVVSISSGSGNHPAPYLTIYSATKAFITQFTRSMKIEWWDSGVDFLAVTPFYVVSNLYKRKTGTIIAPMPIKLVEGTLSQLGKRYIWQGHGYWFHGFLGNFVSFYWGAVDRNLKMMKDNRRRYDERMKSKESKSQ